MSPLAPVSAHPTLFLICLSLSFIGVMTGVLFDLAGKQGAMTIIVISIVTPILPVFLLAVNAMQLTILLLAMYLWSLLQESGALKVTTAYIVRHAKFTVAGLPTNS